MARFVPSPTSLPESLTDTPDGDPPATARSGRPTVEPRSARDLETLRALAGRIPPDDPGAHNNLGVVFYNKGLLDEAVRQFERALELDPRMPVAQRNLEIAYFHTGYFDRITAELRARLDSDPDDVAARRRLATARLFGGDPAGAAAEWRRVLESEPDDVRARLQLARAEHGRGDLDAALAALREAAERHSDEPDVFLRLGELHYGRGMNAEARQALERAIALAADLAEAYHILAFVYGDQGDTERAMQTAARAAELNPSLGRAETNLSLDRYNAARYDELVGEVRSRPAVAEGALAHYSLGLALRQRGLYEEAVSEFEQALQRGEDALLVRQAQAELLLLRGAGADAAALYGELLAQEPGSPKLWNERGVAAHQVGDLEAAEQAYLQALDLDAAYALAWNNLGVVRHHHGDAEGAEGAFRQALKRGRAPADVWRNLGLMLARHQRRPGALEAFRRALELDPHSAPAWTGLGTLLMDAGRVQDARSAFVRAVDADPESAEARYQLAFALSALGDFQGALRETKRALELDPLYPMPRFRLLIDLQFEEARVLAPELDVAERLGAGDAVESFDLEPGALDGLFAELEGAVTAASPDDAGDPPPAAGDRPPELLATAREAIARGQLDRAAVEAHRAEAAGADRGDVLLLLGDVFLEQGLAGEALERFEQALAQLGHEQADDPGAGGMDDQRYRALIGAARSLLLLDRPAAARGHAERLCQLNPRDAESLRVFGRALLRLGEHRQAMEVLDRARSLLPDDAGVLAELGEACAGAGDTTTAESAFRRAIALDGAAVAARVSLGELLAGGGRLDEAAMELRAALAQLPSYGPAAIALAEVEQRRHRIRDAVNGLVDFLTVDPYHLEALARLGSALLAVGEPAEAAVAFRRVLRFEANERARAGLARAEAEQTMQDRG